MLENLNELDETARFRVYQKADGLDTARIDRDFGSVRETVCGYHFLIVPSFLSDALIPARKLGIIDYFNSHQTWLEGLGATVQIADLNTQATVVENGERLAALIAASDRPIFILSHSKGGLDTLEFLVHADDPVLDKIAGWIPLQAPFGGSPVADWVTNQSWRRAVSGAALWLMKGGTEAVRDLRVDTRKAYMDRHDADIARLARRIGILSLATQLDEGAYPLVPAVMVRWAVGWFHGLGVPSDGLVPTDSAVLPYARYIVLHGVDHGMTVGSRSIGPTIEAVPLLKALLVIALTPPQSLGS